MFLSQDAKFLYNPMSVRLRVGPDAFGVNVNSNSDGDDAQAV